MTKRFCDNPFCDNCQILSEDDEIYKVMRPRLYAPYSHHSSMMKYPVSVIRYSFRLYGSKINYKFCNECVLEDISSELLNFINKHVRQIHNDHFLDVFFQSYYKNRNLNHNYGIRENFLGKKIKFLDAGLKPNYRNVNTENIFRYNGPVVFSDVAKL